MGINPDILNLILRTLLRYAGAALLVMIAFGITTVLGEQRVGLKTLSFAAVLLSAWFWGVGPGLLATVLVVFSKAYFVMAPTGSFMISSDDIVQLGVFVLICFLVGSLHQGTRQATERMNVARQNAIDASLAKDRFLAILSHELRNPLNPILATASRLEKDANLPKPIRDDLSIIRRNVELEVRLIDDLLDVNRIAAGKLQIKPEHIDAHRIINEIIRACAAEIIDKKLDLVVDLRASAHYLHVDPARLRQVLWNLVRNAVKFTPDHGVVTVTTEDVPDSKLRIRVTDTGIGIDPEVLPRLFRPFQQGDETVTRRYGGLGLGLAISRMLVEAQGGTVSASSAGKDRGATFTVELPATTQAPKVEPAPESTAPAPSGPLCILLVEDHVDTARALARILRASEHEVHMAHNAADALSIAAQHAFDLVITDLALPDGDGVELMRTLHRLHGLRGIALTGYGAESISLAADDGFIDQLVKPVNVQRLEHAIRRAAPSPHAPAEHPPSPSSGRGEGVTPRHPATRASH